jgi:hypothetical protein
MYAQKILFTAILIATVSIANAQEVGVRFGDGIGGNAAVDGLVSISKYSRVHANVSFGSGLGAEALYDFLYRPFGDGTLNWYMGVGPSVRFDDPFLFGVCGEVGLSYMFKKVPISISGDWRPTFIIIENTNFEGGWFGLNVRYVFGKRTSEKSGE